MRAHWFIGIDPGVSGAVCVLDSCGEVVVLFKMPSVSGQVDAKALHTALTKFGKAQIVGVIEKAQAFKGQGISSTFKYGVSFGIIQGVLAPICPYWLVTPQTWQKQMFTGTEATLEPKQRSALAARRLFPNETFLPTARCSKIDSGLTDAALIAEYARRMHGGTCT